MNPLDSGPQNVLGKRPTLVDPLILELISRIEPLIGHVDIEFEGRLGCLCAPSMDKTTAARIHLPITTEVMVEPSGSKADLNGKPFKFEFVPDLGKEAFEKIHQRLESLLVGKPPPTSNPPNPLFKVNAITTSHTVDEIYKRPTKCRLTFDWGSYGSATAEPREIIVKDPMEKLDVWAGHYPGIDEEGAAEEEGRTRHPFDYRFSINRERILDKASILRTLNRGDKAATREKKRTSFDMKAWVVDMTRVVSVGQGERAAEKFEVEVELKRDLLFEQLERRAKGKSHAAYQILGDFLYFIRDLAYVFGPGNSEEPEVRTVGGFKYPEMTSCEPSENMKKRYRDLVGTDVMPIIGEYIFQIASEVRPPA